MDASDDVKKMFDAYILDYLKKEKLPKIAKAFQKAKNIDSNVEIIEAPEGFVFEWWSIFWDYFSVVTRNNHAPAIFPYQEENARLQQNQLDMNQENARLQQNQLDMNQENARLQQNQLSMNRQFVQAQEKVQGALISDSRTHQGQGALFSDRRTHQGQSEMNQENARLQQNQLDMNQENARLQQNQLGVNRQFVHAQEKLQGALTSDNTTHQGQSDINQKNARLQQNQLDMNQKNARLQQNQLGMNRQFVHAQHKVQGALISEGRTHQGQSNMNQENARLQENQLDMNQENARLQQNQLGMNHQFVHAQEKVQGALISDSRTHQGQSDMNQENARLRQNQLDMNQENARLQQNQLDMNRQFMHAREKVQGALISDSRTHQCQADMNQENARLQQNQLDMKQENARLQHNQLNMNRQFVHAQEQVQGTLHAPNAVSDSRTHKGCVGNPTRMPSRLSSQGPDTRKMGLPPLPPNRRPRPLGQGNSSNIPANAKKRKAPSKSDITGRKRRAIAGRSTPAAVNSSIPTTSVNSSIPDAQVQVAQQSCHDQKLASGVNQKNDGGASKMTELIINHAEHNASGNTVSTAHTMYSSGDNGVLFDFSLPEKTLPSVGHQNNPSKNRAAPSLFDLERSPTEHKTEGNTSQSVSIWDSSMKEIARSDFSPDGILLDNAGQSSLLHADAAGADLGEFLTQDGSSAQDEFDLLNNPINDDDFWDQEFFASFGPKNN